MRSGKLARDSVAHAKPPAGGRRNRSIRWIAAGQKTQKEICPMPSNASSKAQSDQRESQLMQAVQAARIGDWEVDLITGQTRHSLLHDQCFGYEEPVSGWTYEMFLHHVHEGDRERVHTTFQRAMADGSPCEFECRILWPDQSQHWVRITMLQQRDEQGRPAREIGTIADITELRQIEEAARASERQFRVLADSIPNLAWMADAEGSIFWYNQRWYDYTGTTPEEMLGWGWQSVHDPAILPEVLERFRASLRSGEPFEMVFPLRGADGVFRPFLTRTIPLVEEDGRVVRWFGTNTDISKQKDAEIALDQSIRRFQRLADANPFGVVIADMQGKILSVNPAFSRLLGYTEDEIRASGIHGRNVTPPEYWEISSQAIAEVVRRGECDPFEKEYIAKDGRRVPVLVGGALLDATQGAEKIVAYVMDLTTLKRAEDALRKSDALAVTGRLAASIAHEINNPLEAITNLLYLVRYSRNLGEAQAHAARAEKELGRVSQIVTQTLRFYRQSTNAASSNLGEIVDSVLDLYKGRLVDAKVSIDRQFDSPCWVSCYAGEIRQVIANLIGNAVDAMPRGGKIALRVRRSQDRRQSSNGAGAGPGARITIADNGGGMSPEVQRKIFEPFFTTKGSRGTGLGLWVSAEIVQKHQGSLKVRSRQDSPWRGTSFSLFLPESSNGARPAPGGSAPRFP